MPDVVITDAWKRGGERYSFPAVASQRALWGLYSMMPEAYAYHIPIGFHIRGETDADKLQQALDLLLSRHEALRTSFDDSSGTLRQMVSEEAIVPVGWISSGASVDEVERTFIQKPFDLTEGPPFRVLALRLSDIETNLYFCFHHIVLDHLSLIVLFEDFAQIYEATLREVTIPSEPVQVQFADYAVWQEEQLASGAYDERASFWRNNLPEYPSLDVLHDRSRPKIQSFEGSEHRSHLRPNLTASISRFAREAGTTPYVVALSALFGLLRRYSGQQRIAVGTPFANRAQDGSLERTVGLFINTLPVPCEVDPSENFTDLVEKVKRSVFTVAGLQDAPIEKIVESVGLKRDPSYNPLFQVGFTYQDPPIQISLPSAEVSALDLHSGGSMYDLHFWLWDDKGETTVQTWFDTSLYDEKTVQCLHEHYETVLEQWISNPEQRLKDLDYLSVTEKNRLTELNDTSGAVPDQPLAELLLERMAGDVTHRVSDATKHVKHAELREMVMKAADSLNSRGVGEGDYVGILCERSLEMLVGLLAIWRVGAAYVPIDPNYPAERVQYIIEDSGVVGVLVNGEVTPPTDAEDDRFCWSVEELINSGSLEHSLAASPGSDSQPAYSIYTSGSTGNPKGVEITCGNVKNFLLAMREYPGQQEGDVSVAVTTISFDISVLELYLPLLSGADLIIAEEDQVRDVVALVKCMGDSKANFMQATPALWTSLLESGWEPPAGFNVLCGGEPFPENLLVQLQQFDVRIFNMYGPTETTVWSSVADLRNADTPHLGSPILNTEFYVLDENMSRQPFGVPGELFIGGAGVGNGYPKLEQLTSERFVSNPFGDGYLYSTGDLVKFDRRGRLHHMGRADNQVKIRGYRIELEEVESRVKNHTGIEDVAATVWKPVSADAQDARLVVYVVGQNLEVAKIRKELRSFLPEYMVPNHIVELSELPRLPNRKLDRDRLPDPLGGTDDTGDPPTTDAEKAVARIWQNVIGEGISPGRLDNFFQLGGHSLLAVRARAELERELGRPVSLRQLLLDDLATVAAEGTRHGDESGDSNDNSVKKSWLGRLLDR